MHAHTNRTHTLMNIEEGTTLLVTWSMVVGYL